MPFNIHNPVQPAGRARTVTNSTGAIVFRRSHPVPAGPTRHRTGPSCRIGLWPQVALVLLLVAPLWANAGAARIVVGGESSPEVSAFTSRTHENVMSVFPYSPSFTGGVRVAAGDVNGDGAADIITGTGPGGGHVRVFSGRDQSELHSFLPYGGAFNGGVFVAAGDVDGDGLEDIVTGTDEGAGPHVKVFSGQTGAEVRSFFAYPVNFQGGVRVATGDVNGDGQADIITGAGPGGGPHVKVFSGSSGAELHSFFSYPVDFQGGVFVGGGDVDGDGAAEIITGAGPGGGPHVKVFSGRTGSELRSFFAYPVNFQGGVRVAAGDMDGDGSAEILTGPGEGALPHVRIFHGVELEEMASFLAYATGSTDGIYVGASSAKAPWMQIQLTRSREEVRLSWPAGCLCELEGTTEVGDPRSWSPLEVRPVDSGNRQEVLLTIAEKPQFFRLKCDEEAVR